MILINILDFLESLLGDIYHALPDWLKLLLNHIAIRVWKTFDVITTLLAVLIFPVYIFFFVLSGMLNSFYSIWIILYFNIRYIKSKFFYFCLLIWGLILIMVHYPDLYEYLINVWGLYFLLVTCMYCYSNTYFYGYTFNQRVYLYLTKKLGWTFLVRFKKTREDGAVKYPQIVIILLNIFLLLMRAIIRYYFQRLGWAGLISDLEWVIANIIDFIGDFFT